MPELKVRTTNDFYKIVMEDTPLIDVRAPVEYEKGAFPNSINLPLMNDEERHLVGIKYKEQGNEEAVKLGYELVSGEVKASRVEAWIKFIEANPNAMIYCFRGGQRSKISQEWIQEALGREIIRLEGGYKAFRNYLIDALEPAFQESKPVVLSGYTGSGKTILLKKLENAIDLEGIAHHRGSSFGNYPTPQPTQINFENNLAYALIRHKARGYKNMIIEDESRNIGRSYIPRELFEFLKKGQIVILEVPLEERVRLTADEYVLESQAKYIQVFGETEGIRLWHDAISGSIDKVKKRLGGELHQRAMEIFKKAYKHQMDTGELKAHDEWVELLLTKYYDPMYGFQIEQKKDKIIFKGNGDEVLTFLKGLN